MSPSIDVESPAAPAGLGVRDSGIFLRMPFTAPRERHRGVTEIQSVGPRHTNNGGNSASRSIKAAGP